MSNPAKGQSGDGQNHGSGRQASKAADTQQGSLDHPGHAPVMEGGMAETPTEGKGRPKAADMSAATSGKAEQQMASDAAAGKDQHGRGHRKAD